jgi:hypothetical protein
MMDEHGPVPLKAFFAVSDNQETSEEEEEEEEE